jgi:hypothetical protein
MQLKIFVVYMGARNGHECHRKSLLFYTVVTLAHFQNGNFLYKGIDSV